MRQGPLCSRSYHTPGSPALCSFWFCSKKYSCIWLQNHHPLSLSHHHHHNSETKFSFYLFKIVYQNSIIFLLLILKSRPANYCIILCNHAQSWQKPMKFFKVPRECNETQPHEGQVPYMSGLQLLWESDGAGESSRTLHHLTGPVLERLGSV